jgi:hypothetical protein
MDDREQRRFDRLTRVQTFGREHAADFAAGSKASTHFAAIDGHITALEHARAGQRPDRLSKATLLDALWLDFKAIARTARSIGLTDPGFAAAYRVPENYTEKDISTFADALLARLEGPAAADLRAKFIAYEMPADFVEDLRADREALREVNQLNQGETQEGVGNTKLVDEHLAAAARDVQELDAIMHNKYARQPETLRAWQSASHVERAPRRAPAGHCRRRS